jgi:uroporphyrinogen decarboxylase
MTGKERLDAALNFTEADRVPFDLGGTSVSTIAETAFWNAMKHRGHTGLGIVPHDIDPIQQIVFPDRETIAALGIDTQRFGLPRLFGEAKGPVETNGILKLTDQFHCDWQFEPSQDFYYNQTSNPLKDFETIDEGLPGYTFPTLVGRKEAVYAALDAQLPEARCTQGLVLDRNCAGLTEVAFRIRGYEQFFMDMALDPAGAEKLLDRILAYKLEYWDVFSAYVLEQKLDEQAVVAVECDDLGTQYSLLFSPEMLRRIVMPRQRILIQHIKKCLPGIKVLYHSDGAIFDLIPELIDMGVDALNPVQFTAAGMDLALLKKEYGSQLCFWGAGIDTQDTLPHGTPESIREEVKRNLDILAPGGGFVFTTVHNVQADVPPENFWALWDAFMEFSNY